MDLQVATDNIFQDGTLTAGLTPYDSNLRKIDGVVDSDSRKDVLKLVDEAGGSR